MKDIAYICEKIKILFNIDFTCIDNSYRYLPLKQMSPYCTETLKNILIQGADRQDGPYIYKDEYDVCFVCLRCEDRHYMLGPMSMRALSLVEYRKFYHTYEITENNEKYLKRYTPEEILSITELTAILLLDKKYTDEELLGNNPFLIGGSVKKTDEEDLLGFHEEESYHHTYEEERRLLDYTGV